MVCFLTQVNAAMSTHGCALAALSPVVYGPRRTETARLPVVDIDQNRFFRLRESIFS
jgi:hypothetical protein